MWSLQDVGRQPAKPANVDVASDSLAAADAFKQAQSADPALADESARLAAYAPLALLLAGEPGLAARLADSISSTTIIRDHNKSPTSPSLAWRPKLLFASRALTPAFQRTAWKLQQMKHPHIEQQATRRGEPLVCTVRAWLHVCVYTV